MAAAHGRGTGSTDPFHAYFRRADLDGDGRISGPEAVAFFRGSNLPQSVLAQVWNLANQSRTGFLSQAEFYNALKLVTVAQNKRELTPEIVKMALFGPASAKIPAPQINVTAMPVSQSNSANVAASIMKVSTTAPSVSQNVTARSPQTFLNSNMTQQHVPFQQNQPASASQGVPLGVASNLPKTAPSHGISGQGNVAGFSVGITPASVTGGPSSSITQDGFGLAFSELAPTPRPKSPATSLLATPQSSVPSFQATTNDSKLSVSGNGVMSNSVSRNISSGALSQPMQDSSTPHISGSLPTSSSFVSVSSGHQSFVKPNQPGSFESSFTADDLVAGQHRKTQSTINQKTQAPVQASAAFASAGFHQGSKVSSTSQSQFQWPRITQSDVQKYRKVFLEVDKDRDGKISGDQARNLFLSWRLPREVLKQVWDLSKHDNDSVLSLKEFCIALYLMERYREGHPLPPVLPSNIGFDEALLHTTGQSSAAYGNALWRSPGLQQPQGTTISPSATTTARVKPPIKDPVSPAESTMQPSPRKSSVPVLEKHLVDQLSSDEQNSLYSKFKEATEADEKVEELEKEIIDSKQKIEFYRTKMQELVLYKSKCDNRLNEIMERTSADKLELDILIKKYEERYKQSGDVASKLTSEEATFRDIQEKKMELYQAIMKMEQTGSEGSTLQANADRIQYELDDLVKGLNERCKNYGLRAKPMALVELPFGWQPGIQEGTTDWDDDWDKFEDEGFTFVKELTLDVKNIIAPPKAKPSSVPKGAASADGASSSTASKGNNSENVMSTGELKTDIVTEDPRDREGLVKSAPNSPAERSVSGSPSHMWRDPQTSKSFEADGSPHVQDTHSDHGGAESVVSGDRNFDDPSWSAFDASYDTDSVWGFNPSGAKDAEHGGFSEHSFFESGSLDLNPIRTNSTRADDTFPKTSPFTFADSVPSTPVPNFGNSPTMRSEISEERPFGDFSRFDSFSMNDGGLFAPHESLARFDSVRSSRESDHGLGFPAFDDSDPFGMSGPFRSAKHEERF